MTSAEGQAQSLQAHVALISVMPNGVHFPLSATQTGERGL